MSLNEPFAEAIGDGHDWYLVVGRKRVHAWTTRDAIINQAERLNAAVAAREREAAATAMEEAANHFDAAPAQYQDPQIGIALRSRAAAIREGRTT